MEKGLRPLRMQSLFMLARGFEPDVKAMNYFVPLIV